MKGWCRITTLSWLISKIESHPTRGRTQKGEFAMTTLKESVAVELIGRPTHRARPSQIRVAVVSLASAVAIAVSVSLATVVGAGAKLFAVPGRVLFHQNRVPPGGF